MKSLQARYGEDKDGLKKELKRNLGPLYEINWYRIILDEAHQIKNLKAQSKSLPIILYNAPGLLTLCSYPSLLLFERKVPLGPERDTACKHRRRYEGSLFFQCFCRWLNLTSEKNSSRIFSS